MKGFESTAKNTNSNATPLSSKMSQPTRPFGVHGHWSVQPAGNGNSSSMNSNTPTASTVVQMGKVKQSNKKKNTTRDRILRAHKRSNQRWKDKKSTQKLNFANRSLRYAKRFDKRRRNKQKGVLRMETPLGIVNLSKFPTLDLGAKITTRKSDYGDQKVGHKYEDLVEALVPKNVDEKDVANDLLRSTRKRKRRPKKLKGIKKDRQFNAGAKLLSISHVSEERRFGGSGKVARGVLRMIEKGKVGIEEGFSGDTPLFPMAKSPDYMRRLINPENKKFRKKIDVPKHFDELKDFLSESSDEEK